MAADITSGQRFERFLYFFPFRLFLLNLKKNLFLLLFWLLLFGFTAFNFAAKYGVPSLFLYPEYLGKVNFWSFAVLGFSFGGFIMAFNIYTYILHAFRFPFLATLSKPFLKFCINNFIIPALFSITYIFFSVQFQYQVELVPAGQIALNILGLIVGSAFFIVVSLLYFFRTNKDIVKITGKSLEELNKLFSPKGPSIRKKRKAFVEQNPAYKWRVETYLAHPFKIMLARESRHYDKETLRQVFAQNHINATLFEGIVVISFLLIGSLHDHALFVIPAAASACLLFTMILMIMSILVSWFKGWAVTVTVALLISLNALSTVDNLFNLRNPVYGMDYQKPPVTYNTQKVLAMATDSAKRDEDYRAGIRMLNNWKTRVRRITGEQKPTLIIVNSSGGGLRSAAWTMRCLQYADSITNGNLMLHTVMMTGSSGGLMGAAYFRELTLREMSGQRYDPHDPRYINDISADVLNPILFSVATNDLFIRFHHVEVNGMRYVYDRAYSFEDQVNENTWGILDKPLIDDSASVASAEIPMMILAPSVVNDGRRMLISSQPISYLSYIAPNDPPGLNPIGEAVDFNQMFAGHGARKITLLTALRMNATFPYILPMATLPTNPPIEVMDAGLRDNMGIKTTIEFLNAFNDWLAANTSGVILLQLRDKDKQFTTTENRNNLFESLSNPIGSFYGNFFKEQDYNQDEMLESAMGWLKAPLKIESFTLKQDHERRISMSWHLTQLEKRQIMIAVHLPENKATLQDISNHIKPLINEEEN